MHEKKKSWKGDRDSTVQQSIRVYPSQCFSLASVKRDVKPQIVTLLHSIVLQNYTFLGKETTTRMLSMHKQ
jgi:hypothetical protein